MLSDFRVKYPKVPGDVAALERCCEELSDRAQKIRDCAADISRADQKTRGWAGRARDAFEDSRDEEKKELIIWDSGTDEAAASLRRYKETLETQLRLINEVRVNAGELWARYCALPPDQRDQAEPQFADTLSFLTHRYDKALDAIDAQAAITAAQLRAALYFTPEDITKGEGGQDIDVSDTRALTSSQVDAILRSLTDPYTSLIDLTQGNIGDCHLLSSLEAYDRTIEGRQYLASLIEPHHNANGTVDGFLVRFPGLNDGNPILVKEVLTHGNKTRNGGIDVASIFEMAYVKAHRGGTKLSVPSAGASGRLAVQTMREISGQASSFHHDFLWGKKTAQQAAIDAVRDGNPVVAETLPDMMTPNNNITVNIDGQETTIKLVPRHVYTVIGADENTVTLANPWGKNNRPDAPSVGPVFTMQWKDFHKQFGDVTVGATPWK